MLSTFLMIFAGGLCLRILSYYAITGLAYYVFWKSSKPEIQKIKIASPFHALPKTEALWALPTLVIFSFSLAVIYFLKDKTQLYLSISDFGWAYFVAMLPVLILLHDAYFYWTHRFLHLPKVFARSHYLHHWYKSPTPFAALSFHPIEAMIDGAFAPLVIFLIPLHPLHIALLFFIMLLNNAYIHLGYELKSKDFQESWLGRQLYSARLHQAHHQGNSKDFGLYFSFWDRWMGTSSLEQKK